MTAIYISPSPPPPAQAAPQVATAGVAFSGQLEVTDSANATIMQKAIYLARAARITAAWISGVDGLDTGATGQTRLRISGNPYDWQVSGSGIDLLLPAGQSQTQEAGEIAIPAGGWLYIYITQATGGHYGTQVGVQISWSEDGI